MAETRTYDPSAGDPISDAIRAALAGPRPNEPGSRPEPRPDAPAPTITTIGSYTFTKVPAPKPGPED